MLGQVIRQRRKTQGLSQQVLAQKAGISQNYLSDIENGSRTGTLEVLQAIADALSVPLADLMQAAGMATSPTVEEPLGSRLDDWVKEIVALGPVLGPSQRLAVLEHARALARR